MEAFPLHWPVGRPRAKTRKDAQFKRTMDRARQDVCENVRLARGRNLVISTNIELRKDGFPMASRRPPDDTGVAVYFIDRKGLQLCIACDCWKRIEDNMSAIASTIEAMRGIERWGGQQASDQAFAGFAALPPAVKDRTGLAWHQVFNVKADAPIEEVESAYRVLAKDRHPDRGGSQEAMRDLNDAYLQFRVERKIS